MCCRRQGVSILLCVPFSDRVAASTNATFEWDTALRPCGCCRTSKCSPYVRRCAFCAGIHAPSAVLTVCSTHALDLQY
jgi:hypothetical protein